MLILLRPVIIWIVQATLTAAGFALIETLFDKILEAIKEHYGLSDDDSRIVLANYVIDAMALIGVGSTVIAKKLPVKVAEKLGFTSKGYIKRVLSSSGQAKVNSKKNLDPKEAGLVSGIGRKIKAFSSINWLLVLMLFANVGDWFIFGRSMLQKTLRDITGNDDLTLPGAKDAPPGFSDSEWSGYTSALESAGVFGFKGRVGSTMGLYSREGLAQIATYVYGVEAAAGRSTTANALQKAMSAYLVMKNGSSTSVVTSTGSGSASSPTVSDVRVFTGIVSQGVLGSGLSFTPRPDDLIESMSELQSAMNNNISPYLASLLGKIIYEIKIVPSVVIDNLTRRGQAQTITVGHYSNGQPKTRTVVNKFAVADIFILNDKGSRVRVKRLVLGPTDAVRFQPDPISLSNLSAVVSNDIVVTNTDQINTIISNTPTEAKTPEEAKATSTQSTSGRKVVYRPEINAYELQDRNGKKIELYVSAKDAYAAAGISFPTEQSAGASPPITNTPSSGTGDPATISPATLLPATALTAPNLFEFYGALGRQLPSIEARGVLYQSLGLGQAAFYAGTAEQNTKLLQALKQKGL